MSEKTSNPKGDSAQVKEVKLRERYPDYFAKVGQAELDEEKIQISLNFMRDALSQGDLPKFKEFFDIRKECLPLFKRNLDSIAREKLWDEFIEISNEASKLKDLLDEQSAFAVQQLDLALTAVKEDIERFDELLSKTKVPHFAESTTLKEHIDGYQTMQKELSLLSAIASRISSLRKEILKTPMKIKEKNRFFTILTELGNLVFPKRKELIQEISKRFVEDVDRFAEEFFPNGVIAHAPFYVLRDEIKMLQAVAKNLTLSTHAFTRTRELLSKCWDLVKKEEKEKKKSLNEKKQESSKNKELFEEKIAGKETLDQNEFQEMQTFVREKIFTREDLREVKERLFSLKPEKQVREKVTPVRPAKKELKETAQEMIKELEKESLDLSTSDLEGRLYTLVQDMDRLSLSSVDRDLLSKPIEDMRDLLLKKKEADISSEGTDELRALLALRKERRREIKELLESHRKHLGGSSFDFAMAMNYQEMVDMEKLRLEKIDQAIYEVEEEIERSES